GPAPAHDAGIRRPLGVARPGSVTRLARDTDLRPRGVKPVAVGLVTFAQAGRVAVRARVVPVLTPAGPVKLIGVRNAAAGIQLKPALTAVFRGPAVPGEGQRLQ